jgi:NAD-dependent dihydropyrimidine dehydrogenase PreA subunit
MMRIIAFNTWVVYFLLILSSTTLCGYSSVLFVEQFLADSREVVYNIVEPFEEGQQSNEIQSSEMFDKLDESKQFEEFEEIDEFEEFEEYDEFEEFVDGSTSGGLGGSESCKSASAERRNKQLWWIFGALFATIIAGILIRFRSMRTLRGFFMMASMVILGFYVGGCPCPIMSLQHVIFSVYGLGTNWVGMIWFLGLLPVTYLFGKVWCGWICHLGALQEFLFLPGKIKVMQSEKAQIIMRRIRMLLLAALAIQIIITGTNLFKTIDPFKVAFNLYSTNLTGWILLGLILLTSVFMFRPFCKTFCPIGLILGWIGKISGALVLAPAEGCKACRVCEKSCQINAITKDIKFSKLDNQECIACGNCVGDCKSGSMIFVRNSKQHGSKSVCKNG